MGQIDALERNSIEAEQAARAGDPQIAIMRLRESERACIGMRRYSSKRMTLGTAIACRAECTCELECSSVAATPFRTSTSARRAAHTLIDS